MTKTLSLNIPNTLGFTWFVTDIIMLHMFNIRNIRKIYKWYFPVLDANLKMSLDVQLCVHVWVLFPIFYGFCF